MFSGSSKQVARSEIALAITLSVAAGVFFFAGLDGALQGKITGWIDLVLAPAIFAVAILYARRVLQAIP